MANKFGGEQLAKGLWGAQIDSLTKTDVPFRRREGALIVPGWLIWAMSVYDSTFIQKR